MFIVSAMNICWVSPTECLKIFNQWDSVEQFITTIAKAIIIAWNARQHLSKRNSEPCDVEWVSLPEMQSPNHWSGEGVAHEYGEHARHMLRAHGCFELQLGQ